MLHKIVIVGLFLRADLLELLDLTGLLYASALQLIASRLQASILLVLVLDLLAQ